MKKRFWKIWLIARSVLIEAVRRKEVYVIVLVSLGVIGLAGTVRFFRMEGLGKFYREIALQAMSMATALTVVILAARQLPREFERKTVYPLLAKPVGRVSFLLGKYFGVLLAGAFCYGMFLVVFILGSLCLGTSTDWGLLLQNIYLQMVAIGLVAALAFLLSLAMHLDAAVTISILVYVLAQVFTSSLSYIYGYVSRTGQIVLLILNFLIPQVALFDLSAKVVHGDSWDMIGFWAMRDLSLYGGIYIFAFLGGSYLLFRRRAL